MPSNTLRPPSLEDTGGAGGAAALADTASPSCVFEAELEASESAKYAERGLFVSPPPKPLAAVRRWRIRVRSLSVTARGGAGALFGCGRAMCALVGRWA